MGFCDMKKRNPKHRTTTRGPSFVSPIGSSLLEELPPSKVGFAWPLSSDFRLKGLILDSKGYTCKRLPLIYSECGPDIHLEGL